jgi:hypothetical protein
MITLFDNESGANLGTITEEQLQFLIDQFEEEFHGDQDYYINEDELTNMQEAGADEALMTLLRNAMNGRNEMEIRWERK